MRSPNRSATSIGLSTLTVLTVLLCAAFLVLIVSPAFAAEDDIPRLANGKPDLSGNYDLASLTPFFTARETAAAPWALIRVRWRSCCAGARRGSS